MGDIWRIPHLGDDEDSAIAFEADSDIYVFTGKVFRPNFMMALRRTSPDFLSMLSFLGELPRELMEELVTRFDDATNAESWFTVSLYDRVRELIECTDIRVYQFALNERGRLFNPKDPLFEWPGTDGAEVPNGVSDTEAVEQTRLQLTAELGGILAARWQSKDAADAVLWEHNALEQAWIALGSVGHAGLSALQSLWDDYSSLPGQAMDAMSRIPELGRAAIEFGEDGARVTEELIADLSDETWESVKQKLKDLGLEIKGGLERAIELARHGLQGLKALLTDAPTLALIRDFLVGLWDSMSDNLRRTFIFRGIAFAVVYIGVELLIALGLVIVGAGIGAAANAVRRIGQFTLRAVELMGRLIRLMRQMARKAWDLAEELAEAAQRGVRRLRNGRYDYTPDPEFTNPKEGNRIQRRKHSDGDPADPYTLQPDGKPLGASEGRVPPALEGMRKPPPNHDALKEEGWPDLTFGGNTTYDTFTDAKPVNLPPGTKIYRIVDERAGNAGGFWAYELPESKATWRRGFAVKDAWNDNGYYVEHVVGDEGLKAWEGPAAGQEYRDGNFHLEGGGTQLFITPGTVEPSSPKLTNWPEP